MPSVFLAEPGSARCELGPGGCAGRRGTVRVVGYFAFLARVRVPMSDGELLTASQAAEGLSASSQSVRNWIRSGRLPAVRIGNRFLIPRAEIDRLRGGLRPEAAGESPWDFAPDTAAVALPRAGRPSGVAEAPVLGG